MDGLAAIEKGELALWIRQNFPGIWYVEPGPFKHESGLLLFAELYQN